MAGMLATVGAIQQAFMRHQGTDDIHKLSLGDGDYIACTDVFGDIPVRLSDGYLNIMPEDFDESKALRVGECKS